MHPAKLDLEEFTRAWLPPTDNGVGLTRQSILMSPLLTAQVGSDGGGQDDAGCFRSHRRDDGRWHSTLGQFLLRGSFHGLEAETSLSNSTDAPSKSPGTPKGAPHLRLGNNECAKGQWVSQRVDPMFDVTIQQFRLAPRLP